MIDEPTSWPEALRQAAAWFDLVDALLAGITVEDNVSGDAVKLIDHIGSGREIQDDLLKLASVIERHDAERAEGHCAAPLEFWPGAQP